VGGVKDRSQFFRLKDGAAQLTAAAGGTVAAFQTAGVGLHHPHQIEGSPVGPGQLHNSGHGSTSLNRVRDKSLTIKGSFFGRFLIGPPSTLLGVSEDFEYKILTDIQGPEDHHGDMDFKVAGSRTGVTAIQLDVKVEGVPIEILTEALEEAKKARLQILDVIEQEIPASRKDISPNAPKIVTTRVKVSQIGLVIGPGGKTINGIKEKTGAEITIEDDGMVYATGKGGSAERAIEIIQELAHEYVLGDLTKGEVVKIVDFGAFVKIGPNTEGLVHVSEIAPFRVNKVRDLLKEGMIVPVKIIEIDERDRLKLSIKQADQNLFAINKNA